MSSCVANYVPVIVLSVFNVLIIAVLLFDAPEGARQVPSSLSSCVEYGHT